jgi:hypothetical protein
LELAKFGEFFFKDLDLGRSVRVVRWAGDFIKVAPRNGPDDLFFGLRRNPDM